MWMNTQSYNGGFIFFYFKEFVAVNNERKNEFGKPFIVHKETKEKWANSGKSRLIASEALTRWDFN